MVEGEAFAEARFRQGEGEREPRARYDSGLSIHEEALLGGRWIGRSWSSDGFAPTESSLAWLPKAAHAPADTAGLDLGAFGLEVDGQSLHWGWELGGWEGRSGHGTVELKSALRPITLRVHTETDGSGFLTRWLEITNRGDAPAALGAVWVWSGIAARVRDWRAALGHGGAVFRVGSMAERSWAREGAFDWVALPSATLRIESRTGKSGHGTPFFVVRNEASGEYLAGGLAWSGNWAVELTAEQTTTAVGAPGDAFLAFRMGPVAPSPQRVLAPGESTTTPQAHLGLLGADLDGVVQSWHRHLRKSVLSPEVPGREGLVIMNHWSYHQHEMSEEALAFEVDVAAQIGAEVFVVDAGWFGAKGGNWWQAVGDWECGSRLPRGLGPVFDRARSKGLLCGLWLDLERMGAQSELQAAHPEWLLSRYGRPSTTGDMDLTSPAAVAHLERALSGVIERFELDLFRLDYNTWPWEGGQVAREGWQENTIWRYYESVYALYERIRERFPRLVMESCAGGGGRTDLGMVSRFSHTWVTDWPRMPRWLRILNGMTVALPPERIDRCAGVGQEAHERGGLATHLRASMFCRFTLSGVYPGPGLENAEHLATVKRYVELYKRFVRPLLRDCRVFHHTPVLRGQEPEGWAVLEYASPEGDRALAGLFRLAGPARSLRRFRPRGIDPGREYRVSFDSRGRYATIPGADLIREGIVVRLPEPLSSEMLLFEAAGVPAAGR